MSAADHLQGRLFDPASTRAQTPGERSFEQWESQPGVAYHGTYREDWHDAPTAHYGTKGVAVAQLHSRGPAMSASAYERAKLYDPGLSGNDFYGTEDDWNPKDVDQYIEGRVYARKMPEVGATLFDKGANTADMLYRLGEEDLHDIPQSIKDSAADVNEGTLSQMRSNPLNGRPHPVVTGVEALESGKAISYENEIEHDVLTRTLGTTSYVAPKHGVSSWERDVLNDPTAHPMKRDFAKQRVRLGLEGAVEIPPYARRSHFQPTIYDNGGGRNVDTMTAPKPSQRYQIVG